MLIEFSVDARERYLSWFYSLVYVNLYVDKMLWSYMRIIKRALNWGRYVAVSVRFKSMSN